MFLLFYFSFPVKSKQFHKFSFSYHHTQYIENLQTAQAFFFAHFAKNKSDHLI